jgi:uncharacterized protein (DUF1684 family)
MCLKIKSEKNWLFLFAALALFFVLAGQYVPAQTAASGDDVFLKELLKARDEKDVEFKTSATSPMAGRERLTIPAAAKTFIKVSGNEISAEAQAGAGTAFALIFSQGQWSWADGAPGVSCRLGERDITPVQEALPPGCVFRASRFTLGVYPGPDALALIVFDPQRPQLLHFSHLLYFPPDARYAVKARLEKFTEQRLLKITTTRKLEKTFYRYARVHFQLQGRDLALTALKTSLEGPDSNYLFIPFKDDTNGRESYEVGRFLDVQDLGQAEFILDFNRCYNPLCNYSPAYNCPLPPLENILDIAIPAGEKAYPH